MIGRSFPHKNPSKPLTVTTLIKRGFAPSIHSLNQLLSFLLRDRKPHLILQIFSQISSNAIKIDSTAHSLAARALLQARRFKEAADFIADAQRYDLSPQKGLWDALIRGICVHVENPEAALSTLQDCMKSHGMVPSQNTFRSLIFSFSSRGEMGRAIELSEAMISEEIGYPHDDFVCSSIISGFCKIGKPDLGLGFYGRAVKSHGFRLNLMTFTGFVHASCREGRIHEASEIVLKMEKEGIVLDLFVYSIMVDGLCKQGYIEKALDLCARMSDEGIHPNIVVYNSIINGLCRHGSLIEAFRLFDSLEQNGAHPTIVTYATLIGALSREGFLQDATELLERMVLSGITPNTRLYNFLISGYCSFGLMDESSRLLLDLESSRLKPDSFTISAMISGFCVKGNIESALGFFGEYKRRVISPDFLGFTNLIKGLITKGRMEEARTILKEMFQCAEAMDLIKRAGDELHIESLVSLLAVACEQGRVQEVLDVLGEVGFMYFPSLRSSGDHRLKRLEKLHETMTVETPSTSGSVSAQILSAEEGDMNDRLCKKEKDNNGMEDYRYLMEKSLSYDFDSYYPVIASLCSKGEVQQANNIVKSMLLDLEESYII